MLPFTVASYVRECLFEVGGQILAFRRDTDRFALSGFCAHPICEFLRVGVHESALLRDGHSFRAPALDNRDWLPQEFGDWGPAFQHLSFLLVFSHWLGCFRYSLGS